MRLLLFSSLLCRSVSSEGKENTLYFIVLTQVELPTRKAEAIRDSLCPKWHPFLCTAYGPWSKVVHYVGTLVPFGMQPDKQKQEAMAEDRGLRVSQSSGHTGSVSESEQELFWSCSGRLGCWADDTHSHSGLAVNTEHLNNLKQLCLSPRYSAW